uniref:Uncharacterized protein n=1 Tax=Arundo donax TaxID=35708 RepID=A0A0A8Y5H5_ARUDO
MMFFISPGTGRRAAKEYPDGSFPDIPTVHLL